MSQSSRTFAVGKNPVVSRALFAALIALRDAFGRARGREVAALVAAVLGHLVALLSAWGKPNAETLYKAHAAIDDIAEAAGATARGDGLAPAIGDPRVAPEAAVLRFRVAERMRISVRYGEVSSRHARAVKRSIRAQRRYLAKLVELTSEKGAA